MTDLFSRRRALQSLSSGFGYLAFSSLATLRAAEEAAGPLAAKQTHFKPSAKRVIFLCMRGGPSHVDTFDHKPRLTKESGEPATFTQRARGARILGSPFEFKQHGESGQWISELYPHLAKQADELCFLKGMHTDLPNHPQAFIQMHTGSFQFVRPSLGAWSLYGLGSENENLPGFITLQPPSQVGGARNYGSSFLPAIYQGTRIGTEQRIPQAANNNGGGNAMMSRIRGGGSKQMEDVSNPRISRDLQRVQADLVKSLNLEKLEREEFHPEIEGAIESYELGFRMQDAVPGVMDLSSETAATQALYGIGEGVTDNFGKQCLMARRFIEAGVRFVEITAGNWDQHRNLNGAMSANCAGTDKPIAGLLADLKARGLLKDTLVVFAGEFGRTPYAQGADGRDHNHKGFTTWMAGGGVKGGFSHGATDDFGYQAVKGKVHIHDWHATILHLLGLDHEKLTFDYGGRDFRLTDVYGEVVKEILA